MMVRSFFFGFISLHMLTIKRVTRSNGAFNVVIQAGVERATPHDLNGWDGRTKRRESEIQRSHFLLDMCGLSNMLLSLMLVTLVGDIRSRGMDDIPHVHVSPIIFFNTRNESCCTTCLDLNFHFERSVVAGC